MDTKKQKLQNYIINFLLFANKDTDNIVLYYNKSFLVVCSSLNYGEADNFLQNYLCQFDDNLILITKTGYKKNVYKFIKVIDYNMITSNGMVVN
jgi:hypothetical protein